jgi:hypothetical protein
MDGIYITWCPCRPWAERAWQMMAQQQESVLLERLHSKTLMKLGRM